MESLVFNRLSASQQLAALIGERIYPVQPSPDIVLPFITYTRTNTITGQCLNEPDGLNNYGLDIDIWAINEDEALNIMGTVADTLRGWRDRDVVGLFFESQSSQQEELGYHGQQSFSIWIREGYHNLGGGGGRLGGLSGSAMVAA